MASTSSMGRSSLKRKLSTLDPSPGSSRMESSTDTFKGNTPPRSYSSPTTSGYRSKPSLHQKLSSTDALDECLGKTLQNLLVYSIITGKPHENVSYHCNRLQKKVDSILQFTNDQLPPSSYRDKLLTLLASSQKTFVKDIPTNECEWLKLLQRWVRKNQCENDVAERTIYHTLAVDGFRGFTPKNLKYYLENVLAPIRIEYQYHVRGIRAMYEYFEEDEKINSLTGTDSSRVVFLALLDLSTRNGDLLSDDQIAAKVHQNRRHVEGYIYQRGIKWRDLKNVDEEILKTLGERYLKQWNSSEDWKTVLCEQLQMLEMPKTIQEEDEKKKTEEDE